MQQGAVLGGAKLTAVLPAFGQGLPGDGGEGALEESVVNNVALVVFSFDDPVAGIGVTRAGAGEDRSGLSALRGVYEKRSAGAKGVHFSAPGGAVKPTESMFSLRS